jgi:hypothetical protein
VFYLKKYSAGAIVTEGLVGITTNRDYSYLSQMTVDLAPASTMPKSVEYSDISVGV